MHWQFFQLGRILPQQHLSVSGIKKFPQKILYQVAMHNRHGAVVTAFF